MSMATWALLLYVLLLSAANIYLWLGISQGVSAVATGRVVGLVIMLAVAAVFADKFSTKPFASSFISAVAVIGMTLLFFNLLNR